MKMKIVLALTFLTLANVGKSQFTFSVSPGLSFNSASFGYRIGNIVPFIGFQYAGYKLDYEYEYKRFDLFSAELLTYRETVTATGGLYVPNIGVKYFFMERDNLKLHGTLNVTKPIVVAKIEAVDQFGDVDRIELEGISLFGGEVGFGMEYFFSEQFSLGGEFGLRMIRGKLTDTQERTIFHPITSEPVVVEDIYESTAGFRPTFTRISFNFYLN